ncbi:MAG: hypothetical protein IPK63_22080 [Candidatus Competibacteraceae bacterium]|nr:hypothetical protein [Candidatus Competibacteraceae bacterium]
MTLEAWVYPSATMSSWRSILLKERNGGLYMVSMLTPTPASQSLVSMLATTTELVWRVTAATYTWTHLAATWRWRDRAVYINGNQGRAKHKQAA